MWDFSVRHRAGLRERNLDHLGNTVVDLTELVEALVPAKRPRRHAPVPATPPRDPRLEAALRPARPPKRKRPDGTVPEGDALFDAGQCDFGSLVKKLDQVIDEG